MTPIAPQPDQGQNTPMLHPEPPGHDPEPAQDCALCPRLVAYRDENRKRNPDWHNAPVHGMGDRNAWLLLLGLAPGLSGANRTGQPFSGDPSGALLHAVLATQNTGPVFMTNALLCVPPGNKPMPEELRTCRTFLKRRIQSLPDLKVIVALGHIAHQSAIKACGGKLPKHPFAHGTVHRLHTGYTVIDSYHPSPLNTASGRLTPDMLEEVLAKAMALAPGQISCASRP